ncbi:Arm DNA-binding domain-containing protein [Desulfolutivibrio sulfoxidireducens]|uniref:Arm DNA-binding domain-containing protein n=1 Tax=Desulfolutivibrio sulfoxidireducens TaxID=2773299 RepID=UPI003F6133FA
MWNTSGGKSWRLTYRFDGQEKRLVFGAWSGMGAKLARKKRDDAVNSWRKAETSGKSAKRMLE